MPSGPSNGRCISSGSWFDKALAEQFNKSNHGIVISGGGVFLRDQDGANIDNSGWQWNSTLDAVNAIDISRYPLCHRLQSLSRTGRFPRGFHPAHQMQFTIKPPSSALRNSGSVRAMSEYVKPRPDRTISRQYCPTTLVWQLYPHYRKLAEAADQHKQQGSGRQCSL